MAPIFASADIAALIAAYPPPTPLAKGKPALIRSYSKTDVLYTQKVVSQLHSILETEPVRINIADLPQQLNVETVDGVLDCYEAQLYYSQDRRSLISIPRMQSIVNEVNDGLGQKFLNTNDLADRFDLSTAALDELLDANISLPLCRFVDGGNSIVASEKYVGSVRARISLSIAQAPNSERLHLTKMFPDVPPNLLRSFSQDSVERHEDIDGTFEIDGSELFFIPSDYATLQEAQIRREYADKVEALTRDLESQGYCIVQSELQKTTLHKITSEKICADVSLEHKQKHSDAEVVSLSDTQQNVTVIALKDIVSQTLSELIGITAQMVEESWPQAGPAGTFEETVEKSLAIRSSKPTLTSAILRRNDHRRRIEDTYRTERDRLLTEEAARVAEIFREETAAPLQLYTDGIGSISDAVLVEHSEEYICDHFRRECVPKTIDYLRGLSLLRDKGRSRDAEKLLSSSSEAKTLADIQIAVQRFMRKQKIEAPSPELLQATKHMVLDQKVKQVRSMSRGSDVLQNLVWILLAQRQKGLFMSSGKDTSRMIKQYERVGEKTKSLRLLQLRDALKTGDVSVDELDAMRAMARDSMP